MRIGVVPSLNAQQGGSYQFSLSMLCALAAISRDGADAFSLFLRPGESAVLRSCRWEDAALHQSALELVMGFTRSAIGNGSVAAGLRRLRQRVVPAGDASASMTRWIKRARVDWVLHTAPDEACLTGSVPFVMPIFDLQHRLQPEFPEVSAAGEWDIRERLYREGTRRAELIIADSQTGKEDILECYGDEISEERIKVLPFAPAPYLTPGVAAKEQARVRARHALPEAFFFYPAQFWPHKNHLRVVKAVALLKRRHRIDASVVFCGGNSGELRSRTFREVMSEAERAGVAGQIRYLGYVPDEEMSALYAQARALVMPTFFGPTNIPIVEAWLLSCPVVTSDIRGVREQVGDAGLLVDPRSEEAIAEAMSRLWHDEALRVELAARGRSRLARHEPRQFQRRLGEIIHEANLRVAGGRAARVAMEHAQ